MANLYVALWDSLLAESTLYAQEAILNVRTSVLTQRPSSGGWSVAEILEHLCVTDGLYEAPLRALISAERARPSLRYSDEWRPSIMGRLLLWSVNPANTRKSKSPPAFLPQTLPRPHVVEEWLAQVERTSALMCDADGLDLRALKLSSPAAKIIRLNVGDAFAILAAHAARHMSQVRRTIADVTGSAVSS